MGKRTNIKRTGDCGERTKQLIARYYLDFHSRYVLNADKKMYLSMTPDDMLHQAITLVMQDSSFSEISNDSDIMKKIEQRIKAEMYFTKKDHQQDMKLQYADNKQTQIQEA